ncbi:MULTISPECIES: VWA domain-containing protein [unclassified Caldicellulosiruptor]|uniref:VWA domain-containing protein n=1 Tax=unclassified Caldicellulosiruptor TaxID=2622462 RepID=UPI0003A63150|nr:MULTISPECIES: VWA domain-containing protein [unclassified Caldicellulosiruptor]
MRISLERPLILLLIPILGVVIWLLSKRFYKEGLGKKFVVVLRIVIFLLIILALAMPKLTISSNKVATIYLADLSDSNAKNIDKMKNFIQKAIKLKKSNEMQSVVAFGQDVNVEFLLKNNPKFSEFGSVVDISETNIENAIKFAANLFPKDFQKRLVILTDGKETVGNAKTTIDLLNNNGIDVKVLLLKSEKGKDIQFSSLKIPQKVVKNQEFSVFANINSTYSASAQLKIFRDGSLIFSQKIMLEKGENRFVIKDKLPKEGIYRYQGVIEAEDDEEDKNNFAYAMCQVKKPQKVLVVYQNIDDVKNVRSLLDSYSADYDMVISDNVDFGLDRLMQYSFVVLCNVSKNQLTDKFLNDCERYVKDLGGGLLVIGGENSYALGNYSNSVLEKMLPVKMQLKNKEKERNVAVVLVIDHSGSMGESNLGNINKLEIAKSAAAKMIDHLESSDSVGVIAFDHNFYWASRFGKLKSKNEVIENISGIQIGGGTAIIPPLTEAVNTLKKSKAKDKVIVLLTDGYGEEGGYEYPASIAKRNNIKITTIGVGSSINAPILSWMAAYTSGRFYYVKDASNLIDVFLKEAKIIKGKYIKEKKFVPKVVETNFINSAFSSYPPLYGYIATTKKDIATSLLVSDEDEPILTVWRYGLGKTAAWCSDLNGSWSRDWVMWDKFSKFFSNLFKWLEKGAEDDSFTFDVRKEKGLVVSINGKFKSSATATLKCIYPNGAEKILKMKRTSPDKFETTVEFMPGNYTFVAFVTEDGKTKMSTFLYSINYSDEYRVDFDSSRFEQFIALSNAKVVKNPEDIYKGKLKEVYSQQDLSDFLIILCIFLFLLEIAIRRFALYVKIERLLLQTFSTMKKIKYLKIKMDFDKKDLITKSNDTHKPENKVKLLSKKDKKQDEKDHEILDIKKLRRF